MVQNAEFFFFFFFFFRWFCFPLHLSGRFVGFVGLFGGYFGHFLGFGGILVIFEDFRIVIFTLVAF